jgi:hypothetical protein
LARAVYKYIVALTLLSLSHSLFFSFSFSLSFTFSLVIALSLSLFLYFSLIIFLGHKNTNIPLILNVQRIIFFCLGHNILWGISWDFLRGLDLFDPNLGGKKIFAHSKSPLKCPIIRFAHKKNLRF